MIYKMFGQTVDMGELWDFYSFRDEGVRLTPRRVNSRKAWKKRCKTKRR